MISSAADHRAGAAISPTPASAQPRDVAALPRLHHRGADRQGSRADAGFPDNWVYIHDPPVKVGRVQNFLSWSPEMAPKGYALPRAGILLLRGRRAVDQRRTRS